MTSMGRPGVTPKDNGRRGASPVGCARSTCVPLPLVVVVVEDDASSRTSLGRVLRAGGFQPAVYPSAEEYLDAPPHDAPFCLLLDIQLGGLSGLELQRRLQTRGSRVPFIAITAFDDDEARLEAEALGCLGYLRKPCEAQAIIHLIRSLL